MTGRDAYVSASLRRAVRKAGLTHEAMAIALDVERSLVSKQLAGTSPVDANKLDVWLDMTGSHEAVQLILERVGLQAVPIDRDAKPITVRKGFFRLMQHTGEACAEADEALEDGAIDEVEAERMRERLQALADTVQDLMARIPKPKTIPKRRRG